MRTKRIDEIEQYITKEKSVSLDTLCKVFQVSKNTIRRDIDTLAKAGKIKKVYGGVTLNDTLPSKKLLPFAERHEKFVEEKKAICRLAADHIEDDDIIYIDTGTTCHNIVDYISEKRCTIITNSLQVSLKALPYKNLTVISLPGYLKRETLSFVDAVKEAVVSNSMQRYVLADHSKFGIFSLMTYCPLEKINYILTDQLPQEEYTDFCRSNSITVETID